MHKGKELLYSCTTDSPTDPSRFWVPQGAFLQATYVDYGRFQLETAELNPHNLASFLQEALHRLPNIVQGADLDSDTGFDLSVAMLRAIGTEMGYSFPGEISSLEAAFTAFVNKEISMEDLFVKVIPWLQMRLACKGLAALNLHYDPLVYAGQDYTNQIGNAYARFVGQVATAVTRHRLEDLFGNFRPYRLIAKSTQALDLLVQQMPSYDPDEATSPGVQPGVERSSRNGLLLRNVLVQDFKGWQPRILALPNPLWYNNSL